MNLKDLIKEGINTISSLYPEGEAREMVLAYLEHRIATTRHTHILNPDYVVSDDLVPEIRDAYSRMASGEPLQYVIGESWFYGRRFNVSPDVLIPRPETEILCRTVLSPKAIVPKRVLDLCTGSGCIAWTLALEIPGAEVTGVDISDGALAVASGQDFDEEVALTGAKAPQFLKADVLGEPLTNLGMFDVLVSNPPYVMDSEKALMRSNVLDHEPHLALFVSDDDPLVFYRAVAEWALKHLRPEGRGVVEINEALGEETAEIYRKAGFTDVHIIKDLNDKDRFVAFIR
ncbi:MAG: peptide chain release factor N(5)-glutamine methyltransferase [Bacteroidales bacterium]|nr:peptide chain release factor N(5)-glutamine methyltransferase [Bacteroidales bacterium]